MTQWQRFDWYSKDRFSVDKVHVYFCFVIYETFFLTRNLELWLLINEKWWKRLKTSTPLNSCIFYDSESSLQKSKTFCKHNHKHSFNNFFFETH